MGATVFTVGVLDYDKNQVLQTSCLGLHTGCPHRRMTKGCE